jgi:hypothetical protein
MSDGTTMRAADCCRIRKFGTILFNLPASPRELIHSLAGGHDATVAVGGTIRLKLAANFLQLGPIAAAAGTG